MFFNHIIYFVELTLIKFLIIVITKVQAAGQMMMMNCFYEMDDWQKALHWDHFQSFHHRKRLTRFEWVIHLVSLQSFPKIRVRIRG